MDQDVANLAKDKIQQPLCGNCGINPPEGEFLTPLCATCRQSFLKFPIPKWIWAFAVGILVLMGFSFVRMQHFTSQAMDMARAEKAMEQHKYVTAIRALDKVLAKFPDKLEANANMLIASAYNHDDERLSIYFDKLKNKQIDDGALFRKMEEAIAYATSLYFTDTTVWQNYDTGSISSVAGLMKMASAVDSSATLENKAIAYSIVVDKLFDYKKYDTCEMLLQKALREQSDNYVALNLLAAVYRNTNRIDKAIKTLEGLLAVNKEDVNVLSHLCRTLLKNKEDRKAAAILGEAMALDPGNLLVLEAKGMVDFYAGRQEQSKQVLRKLRSREQVETPGDFIISSRLNDIITGKEKFR